MKQIAYVKIYLDDTTPDYLHSAGIIRCGQILSFDEQENETDHQELIVNGEFRSESALIQWVAQKLGVKTNIIEIID